MNILLIIYLFFKLDLLYYKHRIIWIIEVKYNILN